ncbi:MAG: hypothetical protein GY715_09810 [Planctomycetes bacterium]|nr:hypothetical protein [Planctomycetota bacterium]
MRAKVTWISIIVGILALSVLSYAVLIFAALTDPSFAIEENYEAKAANWNELARERDKSDRLGWTVTLATTPAERDHRRLELTVTDSHGQPVREATVAVEALHVARAADIERVSLAEEADGVYAVPVRMRRSGIWEFRIRIEQGGDVYVQTHREKLLIPPIRPPGTTS